MVAACSIIAIHGLEGNLVDTWTHPNTKSFWLKDFLPTNLSGARIMSFGYNADAAFSSAVSDIDDHATDLLNNVVDKRSERDVTYSTKCLKNSILRMFGRNSKGPSFS